MTPERKAELRHASGSGYTAMDVIELLDALDASDLREKRLRFALTELMGCHGRVVHAFSDDRRDQIREDVKHAKTALEYK